MTNYYARTEYDGDGIEDDFDFTWSYISASHVHVYVDDVEVTTGWSLSTSSRVTFVVAPAAGTIIRIQRETSRDTRLVDYVGGSALTEASLDTDSLQAHYMAQEAIDVSTAGIVEALAAVTGTGSVPGISTPSDNNKVLLVDAGVAKWQKVGAVNMNFTPPSLSTANIFLASCTFSDALIQTASDDGATAAPDFLLYRTSASPAANDFIGGVQFGGANSAAASVVYGEVRGQIKDATDSTEDGQIAITVSQDGSLVDEARIGLGMSVGASNTPQGVGTINVDGFHKSNTAWPLAMAEVATTSGLTVEITPDAIPTWAREVTIDLIEVGFDAVDQIAVQLKDSAYVATGYTSYVAAEEASSGGLAEFGGTGVGFVIPLQSAAGHTHVRFVLTRVAATNKWVMNVSGYYHSGSAARIIGGGGFVTLSSELTAIRLSTTAGATYDLGSAVVFVT